MAGDHADEARLHLHGKPPMTTSSGLLALQHVGPSTDRVVWHNQRQSVALVRLERDPQHHPVRASSISKFLFREDLVLLSSKVPQNCSTTAACRHARKLQKGREKQIGELNAASHSGLTYKSEKIGR